MKSLLLKVACLALYALAVAALFGWPQGGLGTLVQRLAIILLIVHLVELAAAFKHVKRQPGSLALNVLLTLLFGLLQWKPAAKPATPETPEAG